MRCMDRFHDFILLNENPPDGFSWSGEEPDNKTNDLKAGQIVGRYVETYV